MPDDRTLIDQWSPLSHKTVVGDPQSRTRPSWGAVTWSPPSWVPDSERRRLAAYLVRDAYQRNVARMLLPADVPETQRVGHREYGDPSILTQRIVSAVLGEDWSIIVDGADDDLLAGPTLPEMPQDPGEGAHDLEKQVYRIRLDAWRRDAQAAVEVWAAAVEAQPAARRHQAELREWADRIELPSRLVEGEGKAVPLGDVVYVLWPRDGDWPRVEVNDPDSYFPELPDDGTVIDFPDAIHIAWEWDDDNGERWVRRMSWRLIPIVAARVTDGPDGPEWIDGGVRPGEVYDPETETLEVPMKWLVLDDNGVPTPAMASETCWFSDASWPLSAVQDGDVDALNDDAPGIHWHKPPTDLGVDFIPVIHEPNTPAGSAHYGDGIYDKTAQIIDDIAALDGDLMSAASYVGAPTIALSGAQADTSKVVAPGRMYGLGADGSMDVLDLSAGLEKLMGFADRLDARFWQNSGVPRVVVGRVDEDGDQGASGVRLLIEMAPYAQLIGTLRLPRQTKRDLMLKFATRMAMHAGAIEPDVTPRARFRFGSFLPVDQAQIMTLVARGLEASAISTQTAVAMLIAAGLPIDDARAEVERIHSENVKRATAAKELAEATASEQVAADWFGVELPERPAPVIDVARLLADDNDEDV